MFQFICDLNAAKNEFFQTLQATQQHKVSVKAIETAHQRLLDQLDTIWNDLQGFAQDDLVDLIAPQLNTFLMVYARQKALSQFLEQTADAWNLNSATPGLADAITMRLAEQHSSLSAILSQILTNAQRERQKAQQREEEARATNIPLIIQGAHADARESLKLAMSGTRQVQDAFPLILGSAVKLAESANDLVKSNNEHLKQHLPSAVEAGVIQAGKRQRKAILFWVLMTPIIMLFLFLLAALLVHFL